VESKSIYLVFTDTQPEYEFVHSACSIKIWAYPVGGVTAWIKISTSDATKEVDRIIDVYKNGDSTYVI
jgi:hypothetical protein